MQKVLVSACLLGRRVRWDGDGNLVEHPVLARWRREGRVVAICPEVEGQLGVPRPPAEIVGGDGEAVLDGRARVVTDEGADVTDAFLRGARAALESARANDVCVAVLKARSPSCGADGIYDGSFSSTLQDGVGVTVALLRRHGIEVFDESELDVADAWIPGD